MIKSKRISLILSTVFSLLLVAGIGLTQAQSGNVVDVINESEDHTIFSELLAETELDEVISQQGPFTVVAPNDAAFNELGDELDRIKAEPELMQNIVIGHLFQGEVTADEAGPTLDIEVVEGDIPATNGLVHVTNKVIMN